MVDGALNGPSRHARGHASPARRRHALLDAAPNGVICAEREGAPLTDLFLSYKAEDRPRVAPLVQALEADGYSVWWDADIAGGDEWRETICRYLDAAQCVIVVWSRLSVGPHGHFVKDEATRALRRGVYLPVRIDKVDPPLGFGETQALNLERWKGDRSDSKYRAVLAALANRLGKAAPKAPAPASGLSRRGALIGGAAVAGAVAIGGWTFLKPAAAKADSIAVMPFANLSGDPAQEYFSDGIAEELRSALARVAGLRVVARSSSEIVRDDDAKTAARKLKVANILTGSVRRSPAMIRISAQLVDGDDGVERWSEIYDRPVGDMLQIQTDIADKVAKALRISLGSPGDKVRLAGGTSNPAAQDLYFKAVAAGRQGHSEELLRQAIGLFDAAIALDPEFAEAHAQKALLLADLTGLFSNDAEDFDAGYREAAAIARHAISLAPQRARGHAALAGALAGQLDVRGAVAEYRKAAEYYAGESEILSSYSFFLSQTGFPAEALRAADKAIAVDPLTPVNFAARSQALYLSRRYPETIESIERIFELTEATPDIGSTRIGDCYVLLGEFDRARHAYGRATPDNVFRLTGEAILAARTGNRAESDRKLERLRDRYGDSAVYQQAEVLAQQGETDKAFAALDRALEVRDPGLMSVVANPFMDPLRQDVRYAALVKRLNFPTRA